MKRLLLILFLFSTFSAFSQSFYRYRFEEPWSISASLGPTQYFGELYSFWKYNEGIQPDWHANFSVNYIFGTHLKARLEGTYYKMSGSDPPSDPRAYRTPRNLSFKTSNIEVATLIEYYWHPVKVNNITRHLWNPYIFAGIGMSTNNPKAELNGTWVDLRPLQLENNPYNDKIVVFPMGLGFKYKLNVYMDMKVEGNYRFTLTDYMDDISAYNISEFYLDLVDDYVTGNNPDRLRLAIRNPDFVLDNGEPDVDAILRNKGRIRRGSGLTHRYDGYLTISVGLEIYLSPDIWDNWIFRDRIYEKRFRFW
ncbi:outer membrane beta-barrel protein [Algoriphagus boritolerans]|uniref:Outer membrane protein beta-barrel domain-containing protein n=2 Tax=Algoriphagus TaxID=246875 RepID=A0A1H5WMP5_9BACT|nr:outer membrane beta-barrel protein [Algoriphagus boritolerans]SEG00593.1 Outer membrane protein beta-barrel domain-containing protein [Algoriphagus boritolerans DSM 17298 = JCM 18970]